MVVLVVVVMVQGEPCEAVRKGSTSGGFDGVDVRTAGRDCACVARSWVKELQKRGDPNVVIALAGNKSDLEHKRKVETEEAEAYARENGILHLETSAKSATNVKSLFVEIARKLPKTPPETPREAFPILPPKSESRGTPLCLIFSCLCARSSSRRGRFCV